VVASDGEASSTQDVVVAAIAWMPLDCPARLKGAGPADGVRDESAGRTLREFSRDSLNTPDLDADGQYELAFGTTVGGFLTR